MKSRACYVSGCTLIFLVCLIAYVYFMELDYSANRIVRALSRGGNPKQKELTALPRLKNVSFFKNCDAYNELRDVKFVDPSLQNILCTGATAYALVEGRFPMCQLNNDLPRLFYDEVNKTARLASVQRAIHADRMPVYTFSEQDMISRGVLQSNNWETGEIRQMLGILKNFPPKDVTFMDIGSNLGLYSLQAREEGYPVIAVDANIRTLLRMQMTARKLGILDEKLKLFWCFLDDEVALKHMNWVALTHDCHIGGASSGSTSWVWNKATMDTIPVMTARTDDLIQYIQTKKVIIKMDIESGEHMFMKTGTRLFKEFDVLVLQMEFWRNPGTPASTSPFFKYITDFMTSRNFSLISVGSRKVLNVTAFGAALEWDGMWVRNDFLSQVARP